MIDVAMLVQRGVYRPRLCGGDGTRRFDYTIALWTWGHDGHDIMKDNMDRVVDNDRLQERNMLS
jgi:hypothetical protein